jgi:hypothetical protein
VITKVLNPQFQEKVLAVLKASNMPCGIEYVGKKTGVPWVTARGALMDLALQGRVSIIRTQHGLLFTLPKEEAITT